MRTCGFGGDDRLGVEGDAEAGGLDHGEIVGAVADREGCSDRDIVFGDERIEAVELGLLAEDRIGDGAGQHVAVEFERVGHRFVEADALADPVGKEGEAARDQRGVGAIGLHGLHQSAAAGGEGDLLAADFFDAGAGQALQQFDAGAQRRLEIEFAIHGARGDRGDLVLDADGVGQLVDAFLLDHGRIHVGDQQALAAVGERDQGDIDRACRRPVRGRRRPRWRDAA